MNPRTAISGPNGEISRQFQRHLATLTTVPVRGGLMVAERGSGRPTDDFTRFWQAAFNRTLRDEPIVSAGVPTRYLLDELRGIENA